MNNKIKKVSPLKAWWTKLLPAVKAFASANPMLTAGLVVGGAYLANKARKNAKKSRNQLSNAQANFDARLKQYEEMKFQPIDPSIADQENIFEDMEIDTTSYELQRKAFLQQQANILQSLQSVGGSSGAAGLATALSRSAEQQSEQAVMTTAQMINRQKELKLQEQGRINQAMTNIELANAEGARQFELDKLTTLLGVEGQKIAGIRGDIAGRRQMYGQIAGAAGSIIGGLAGNPNFGN
jgi:hypothetical protein